MQLNRLARLLKKIEALPKQFATNIGMGFSAQQTAALL
jgi:hypothetical protein